MKELKLYEGCYGFFVDVVEREVRSRIVIMKVEIGGSREIDEGEELINSIVVKVEEKFYEEDGEEIWEIRRGLYEMFERIMKMEMN